MKANECIGGPRDGDIVEANTPTLRIPSNGLPLLVKTGFLAYANSGRIQGRYKKVMIPVWVWEA